MERRQWQPTRLSFVLAPVLLASALLPSVWGQAPAPSLTPGVQSSVGELLPRSEGLDALVRGCNRCHLITAVIGTRRDRAAWTATVENMRGRGATVSDSEAASIVAYLSEHFGPGSTTPGPAGARGGIFMMSGRVPDVQPTPGQPLETRNAVGAGQLPAFEGQTRAPAVRTSTTTAATVVASGLRHPWSLAFLPDGRMLVSEKPGALRIVTATGEVGPPITGVPRVVFGGDAGLLDVVLDPAFETTHQIFFSFVEPRDGGNGVVVARARLSRNETALEDVTNVLRVEPTVAGNGHYGGRLHFDRNGHVLVTLGERFDRQVRVQAQHLDSRLGKILRLNSDGTAPPGNPFAGRTDGLPDVWSYGHRNPQGLAFHPLTGELWSIEHGEAGGDELNIIRPGRNYGWPLIGYGTEYDLRPINGGRTSAPNMEQPAYFWDPAIGPTSMVFYDGVLVPEWRHNLFVTSRIGQHLARLVFDGDRVIGEERLLLDQRQMMRWVGQGPDGALWVLTDHQDGRLIRLAPSGTR